MSRGVTCSSCGGSTPLPDDLRVPTFQCAFCGVALQTAAYAGQAAVSADQLSGYLHDVVSHPHEPKPPAPRFASPNAASREAPCKQCGAPVTVPLDLRATSVDCAACGRSFRVDEYVGDGERLAIEMQRALAGKEALAKLRAEGLACHQCGGRNDAPADGSVQVICRFCGTTILLSEYVDADALARARLRRGLVEMRDERRRAEESRNRMGLVIGIVVAVVAVLVAAGLAAFGVH